MSMSKKDFEAIARAIRESKQPASQETETSLKELSHRLASIMELANPRFDRARFLKACGITQD